MIFYTDSLSYAKRVLPEIMDWEPGALTSFNSDQNLSELAACLYSSKPFFKAAGDMGNFWQGAFLIKRASFSHYDLLVELSGKNLDLPDGILCLAGSGKKFRGQRQRPWVAEPGNIHLVAWFRPDQEIQGHHVGFPILAALSVVEAIDCIDEVVSKAAIKWVNDIIIERAKVAGFISHIQTIGDHVKTAVLGIGLNVETNPIVVPTPFVPEVTSLNAAIDSPKLTAQHVVLNYLLKRLDKNYQKLLAGKVTQLLEKYRKRSTVIGKEVAVLSDSTDENLYEIASGKVTGIGDHLELFIEGHDEPVDQGRLIIKS